jgi:hypothetical protein
MTGGRVRRQTLSSCLAGLAVASLVLPATALAQGPAGSPAAAPSQDASAGPGWLGATTEVYVDDFSVPSGWQVVDDEAGRSAYEDGGLVMSVAQDHSTLWDDHRLPAAHAVLRVEALIQDLQGAGGAGVACGSSLGLPRYLYAAVNDQDEVVFGRIIDTRLQVIDRRLLPGDVDPDHVRLGIECASVPEEGGDYALVTVDGVALTLPAFDIPVGPYDAATLVMSADTAPLSVLFDDLVVHAGEAYAPRELERDPDKPST